MNPLLQTITDSLGNSFTDQLSQSLGEEKNKTKGAIDMAIPILLGALKKNTDIDGGKGVLSAIEKKHDGGILNNFSDLISNPDKSEGPGILKHLLGEKQENAQKILASQSGISEKESGSILTVLAPMLLGAIGKNSNQSGGLNLGNITSLISGGAEEADKKSSLSSSLLSSFLDADNDGSIMDDLAGMAMKKFLG